MLLIFSNFNNLALLFLASHEYNQAPYTISSRVHLVALIPDFE